jgi:vacuolar protein 8
MEDLLVRVKNGAELKLGLVARKVSALAEQGGLGEDDEDEFGLLISALLAQLSDAGDAEIWVLVMVIRLQRIHNFCCSMLVFTPFA